MFSLARSSWRTWISAIPSGTSNGTSKKFPASGTSPSNTSGSAANAESGRSKSRNEARTAGERSRSAPIAGAARPDAQGSAGSVASWTVVSPARTSTFAR